MLRDNVHVPRGESGVCLSCCIGELHESETIRRGRMAMKCPKCKAKVGIMKHIVTVETGAVHCIKCYICGFWVQTEA